MGMQLLSRTSRLLISFAHERGELRRDSASGPGWTEVYIDRANACGTRSTADAVVAGYELTQSRSHLTLDHTFRPVAIDLIALLPADQREM